MTNPSTSRWWVLLTVLFLVGLLVLVIFVSR
jgi:hypothetical protein